MGRWPTQFVAAGYHQAPGFVHGQMAVVVVHRGFGCPFKDDLVQAQRHPGERGGLDDTVHPHASGMNGLDRGIARGQAQFAEGPMELHALGWPGHGGQRSRK